MVEIRNSYAIVIGINQYAEPSWKLRSAVNDACKLTEILKDRYEYEVLQLLDEQATHEKLNHLLTAFENQTIPFHCGSKKVEPDDRVLFYFAGHGIAVRDKDDTPQGFIYSQDTIRGDNKSLVPMQQLHDALVKLGCRHLLIILDCCFAGSFRWVTRQAELSEEEMYLERYNRYIAGYAQEVITSAAYNERAADILYGFGERGEDDKNSPFAEALLEALNPNNEKNADFNKDGIITITEILKHIEDKFLDLNAGQTPGYSQLKKHDFGKYIFVIPGFDAASKLKTAPLPDEKDPRYPYKGLLSFEQEDKDKFCGRKRLQEKLARKVKSEPLTVVLGASGSGKSSLVKAGLIPDLKSTQSEFKILDPIRPSKSPLVALARVCKEIENPSTQSSKTELYREKLNKNEKADYFANKVGNWSLVHLNQKLLLVIDQFEELVTLCRNESERLKFLQQLASAIVHYPEQLRIVITLRSDYEPLIGSLFKSQLQSQIDWAKARLEVSPMTREELREAIIEPAEKIALFFEEKTQESDTHLVDQLIDEVINMPGGLPLLSFTLSELYRKFFKKAQVNEQYYRVITHKDYQELGRVTGSLTKRADEIYEKLKIENKDCAQIIKHVMLRMVSEGRGNLARRRVFMTELQYPQPFQNLVDEIIKEFTQARLFVKGRDEQENEYVEPAHDALIRGWSQLREWLEPKQAQEELAIQRRLTPAAEEWNHQKPGNLRRQIQIFNWLNYLGQRNEQANYLWNANPYLDILKKILNSPDNWFNQLETEFVQLSIQKRTNNWRLRWGLIVTAFTVVSGFAFIQWCESRNAETGRLAALSEASFNSNQQLEALINSLKAGKQLQLPIGIKDVTKSQTMTALQQAVYSIRERNRLQGHRNTIRNVSFSPNGQIIASGSADNTIKLWDLQGLEINTLKGHQDLVNSVSFSPNGQMLASASYDKTIKLWSINGKLLSDIPQAHKAEVYGVSFSPDGKMLVSASWDGTIKLWSIRDRHLKFFKTVELPLKIIEANKKDGDTPKPYSFHGVSFSPDGKLIAAGNEDQNVRIWNRDGKLLKTLQGHSERVYGVSFSPNGKMLASFSGDNTIILWNPLDGKKLRTLIGHKSDVYSTMFSPDSKTLISGSNDNTIKFWRVEDGKEIKTLAAHSNAVRSVNISPDGKMLVSGSIDSTIKLWSVDSEDAIALTRYRKKVNSISFSPNSNTIATGSSDFTSTKNGNLYQIKLWRKSDGRELRTLAEHESEIISTSFSPDGQILASGDTGGNIILWNPANGKILKKWKAHEENIHGLSFSPDGKLLASASHDKTIKLWDRKGQLLTELPKQENKVLSVSFSPDSKMIAWGSLRTITLWNLEQHKVIKTLEGHDKGFINSLSFSSNGLILASGGEDTMVKLWSIPDGKELHKLEGHTAGINSVSFHPNSDILASASDDKTIKLWNIKQGKEISTLKGHSAPVYGVSFSPDRLTLGSASADSTALLWNTELFDLNVALARGCKWVNNYLNNPEIGKSDQDICDNVSETNLKVKISSGDKNLVPTRPYPDKLAGIDAFIDGKLDIAAKHLQNYLNKNPNDPEALIYKNNAEINQQKSYTIAVSVPLGSNVNGALEILRGVAQAQNEINLAGGINGVKLRVLIADDENNPTVARQVAKELVKNTAVLGVIGNYASDIAQMTSKVYSDNKLVAIYPVSTSVNLAMGNYLFRTVPSDKQASLALAEYMQHQLNKQKVAILYNSKSEYSRSFKSEFERTLKPQQIVSVFDFSAEDFKADRSVNSLLKAGAEVLVLLPDTEKLNQTLEVLNENAKRPKLPVLGGDSLYSPAILEIGADNAKDTILSVPWNWETARLSGSKFTSSSQHLWHGSVSWRTAMSYDATIALIAALQKKNTREGVAQVLQAKDFSADGASGKIRFVNGERAQNSQLVKVQRKGKSRSGYDYDFVPLP